MSSERNIGSASGRGARAGGIAAAAVTGALLGFGLRAGTAARPFNAAAALAIGNDARGVWGFVAGVSIVGELVVVATCLLAGVLCAWLLEIALPGSRTRHPRLLAFAVSLAVAVAALLLIVARAPDFIGGSPLGALSISEGAVLSLVVSVAYASGMGLAR